MNLLLLASPAAVVTLVVTTHLLGHSFQQRYYQLALQPRQLSSIWRIATYPVVHISWRHLFFNVLPLLLLGLLIAANSIATFWLLTIVTLLVSGWGTWLCSTADRVVGASGLVFGYWGFIITSAAISQDPFWTAAAALTLMIYAGLWSSLMKLQGGISWAGHFWGLLGGVATAFLVS
jgi:membrane associated rhomboid family serine protease